MQLYIVTQRRIFYGNIVRKHNEISIYSREAKVGVLHNKSFALIKISISMLSSTHYLKSLCCLADIIIV